MKRSCSKEVETIRTERAKENVLDTKIHITSSENVQSHQETKTKGLMLEDFRAITVKMRNRRPKTKHVLWLKHLMSFSEGHTPKGVGLRVADSHTGNHRKDDFMPLETFGGFPKAYVSICDASDSYLQILMSAYVMLYIHIYICEALHALKCVYNRVLVLWQRLPHMVQAAMKASTKVAGCCKGCSVAKKASIKASDCFEGCHISCCKGCHRGSGCCGGCHIGYRLLRRLPHRLQAIVKAATKVAGCCEGCNLAKKAAIKASYYIKGCKKCSRLQTAVKAGTKVAGYYEGCNIVKKAAQRRLLLNLTEIVKMVKVPWMAPLIVQIWARPSSNGD
ncbi:hypothetical protein Tco_1159715 [Tanacetum coccineum]